MIGKPYAATIAEWEAEAAGREREWPSPGFGFVCPEPLWIKVTTPKDQSALHLELGPLSYVPMLMAQDATADYWRFTHPDGPQR